MLLEDQLRHLTHFEIRNQQYKKRTHQNILWKLHWTSSFFGINEQNFQTPNFEYKCYHIFRRCFYSVANQRKNNSSSRKSLPQSRGTKHVKTSDKSHFSSPELNC